MAVVKSNGTHSLFLRWGKLEIGAVGIPAVLTVLAAIVLLIVSRTIGIW